METGGRQYDAEQEQRAVAALITANEISSIEHGSKRVDMVKVCLNEDISVVLSVSRDQREPETKDYLTNVLVEVDQRHPS